MQDGFGHSSDTWTVRHGSRVAMEYHDFAELSHPELVAALKEHYRVPGFAATVAWGES